MRCGVPRTGERGGPQTRARIAEVAARLFLDRGFDAVTVAEVARVAGVSSVTVFNHFPRKEDLYLDRAVDAVELLRGAVRDRAPGVDVVASLRDVTLRLVDARNPLSGVNDRSVPFFRTVAASPALVGRAREIAAELERTLAEELERDPTFRGDAPRRVLRRGLRHRAGGDGAPPDRGRAAERRGGRPPGPLRAAVRGSPGRRRPPGVRPLHPRRGPTVRCYAGECVRLPSAR